jgi:hypothetical protein
MNFSAELTPEEAFLWECARGWREPESIPFPDGPDWERIAAIAVPNRMAWLLRGVLQARGRWDGLPAEARDEIDTSAERLSANAAMLGVSLAEYLRRADARGLETVILKGLSISANVYGAEAMRPGGDIDLLVRAGQVGACIEVLAGMDIDAFWPNLMADAYFERHHLHQQRSTKDLRIWYEIHWALDHPYTLFTIDYEAMLDRTTPGSLLGEPVRDLAPPDLLQALAVHLVKHAVYLPSEYERPDLARAVLADGMLMYYLDIAEAIRVYGERMDWDLLVRIAAESGTGDVLGSVLRACRGLLGAAVPEQTLAAIPVTPAGPVTRRVMSRVVDREIAGFLGKPASRFWDAMLITNGAFILRPIRLLESAHYFLPPDDYLVRKYGQSGWSCRIGHFLIAVREFAVFGWDSVYYAVERHRRLKRIGYSTSLFNRLETEG